MKTKKDAKTTLKSAIIGALSKYGGESITATNGDEIAEDIIKEITDSSVVWATRQLTK